VRVLPRILKPHLSRCALLATGWEISRDACTNGLFLQPHVPCLCHSSWPQVNDCGLRLECISTGSIPGEWPPGRGHVARHASACLHTRGYYNLIQGSTSFVALRAGCLLPKVPVALVFWALVFIPNGVFCTLGRCVAASEPYRATIKDTDGRMQHMRGCQALGSKKDCRGLVGL
jgi:hypothetical protein